MESRRWVGRFDLERCFLSKLHISTAPPEEQPDCPGARISAEKVSKKYMEGKKQSQLSLLKVSLGAMLFCDGMRATECGSEPPLMDPRGFTQLFKTRRTIRLVEQLKII